MREKAHVREVGPRDGIQMVPAIAGLQPSVLVPNLKGAERAFALGVPMVN